MEKLYKERKYDHPDTDHESTEYQKKLSNKYIEESLEAFSKADELFKNDFSKKIDEAMQILQTISEYNRKGYTLENNGYRVIQNCIQQDIPECRCINDRVSDIYDKEIDVQYEIMYSLVDIQNKIALKKNYDKKVETYYDEYVDCLNRKY